ncbi:hypothetical protein [Halorussus halophilus]|uniref:hypothetical protein n=1 Tax=Halorussus halophilus TaxID=2650975 RepID=UPI0013017E1A|nr:hypothetical protein [Halorussus halophilus]
MNEESDESRRLLKWVLLEGNRFVIAGGIAVGVAVLVYALTVANVITVGPKSNVRSLLSSGIASGLLTLVTVALSINQLLLSRVFGSPKEFSDRIDGTSDFRARVADAADKPMPENHPTDFLLKMMRALHERSEAFEEELDDAPEEVVDFADHILAYADSVIETIESDTRAGKSSTMDVMTSILGPEYAHGLSTIPHLQDRHGSDLSEQASDELERVLELLKGVAIFRQFLKTMAIQQDLARLSRLIAYSGIAAVVTTFVLSMVYGASSTAMLSASLLPPVISIGLGIIVVPLALLVSYILRVATISRYTVSAGSFVPPEEQFEN